MARIRTDVEKIFNALGDPTRRAIIKRLSTGPLSASHLAAPLAITLAAVVQHLQVLEESGLVKSEKVGRIRTCRLEPNALTAAEAWINARKSEWEWRFEGLGELLGEDPNG